MANEEDDEEDSGEDICEEEDDDDDEEDDEEEDDAGSAYSRKTRRCHAAYVMWHVMCAVEKMASPVPISVHSRHLFQFQYARVTCSMCLTWKSGIDRL